ncbi:UDP-N-acetylmuramate dehydrogenase [Aquimarina sp. AD10]|uniref:UDP-N-acetylmuramate dehydrogenase n=1 Tax=Aquimarina sp. AD10 TaxID=1714849 RepID=UPI000E4E1850|nr:UDP-N-acetylmuramate dehydrogenase [Aquimarina sp. AD10]AXT63137.1 UDP-N-acetylmuramate dehydrogenase [Aquimarina sp. AD10]RKM98647.1 UDP-N-acetylmuramate dehydrogenase [Aquimarina sp. AD10]
MKIAYHKSLREYNTFGIDVTAAEFLEITSETELKTILLKETKKPIFILSGGSNMLLTKNLDALVLHIAIKGIKVEKESEDSVIVTANAGENWHEFVQYCISKNYGGLENLSLIPGYVGSAPIQNIGAYGVELKDTFVSCEAVEISTGHSCTFTAKECKFEYRNSIFKNEVKGRYIITKVTFKLTKKNHILNTNYGAIETALATKKIIKPTIKDVSEAVIEIRKSKLPDPVKIGNSGSFFKNPVISSTQYLQLKNLYPTIPSYKINEESIKIPAGWLIEQCGFKGKRWGDAGVHEKQALVLVNYNNATGKEILEVSLNIKKEVLDKFNIKLETEVNIL